MKFAGVLVLVLGLTDSIYGVPVKCKETVNLQAIENSHEDIVAEARSHQSVKRSTPELCPLKIVEDEESTINENNQFLLPTSALPISENTQEALYVHDERNHNMLPYDINVAEQGMDYFPIMPNQWPYYQVENIPNSEAMEMGSVLYPLMYSNLEQPLNPIPTVNYLPPVHTTHIHETIPDIDTEANYDLDGINPQNDADSTMKLRAIRSRHDDFMAELAHDAMLNNIVPTMPVPFVRNAGPVVPVFQIPQQQYGPSPLIASYPGNVGDCAQPLLFGCSPKVAQGSLRRQIPVQSYPSRRDVEYFMKYPYYGNINAPVY